MANDTLTFVSYSRRQLYFAEALALHLQKAGIKIWFDLQQLQAGTDWSEGLEKGVKDAKQMVLVVSEASLASPYTQAEWQGFAEKGRKIALVIYEAVELPDELKNLPSYDFRSDFQKALKDLVAFLEAEAEPRHDPIPTPNSFDLPTQLPTAIWLTVFAQFGAFSALFLSLLLTLFLSPAQLWAQFTTSPLPGGVRFFFIMLGLAFLVGTRFALPFLQHKLVYKKVKRGVLLNFFLLFPALISIGQIGAQSANTESVSVVYLYIVAALAVLILFIYIFLLRRSAGFLRWMQSEEDVQSLRRRVHQPLVEKAKFDIAAANETKAKAVTYCLHADAADRPFARWVEKLFKEAGHVRVAENQNPERHIALLSNRSADAWVQEITSAYAGKLAFVVISTIEFDDSLRETGRYQWVDARGADDQDIEGLARSLGEVESWKREAALEATPAMIHRWKVPNSITLLKRVFETFAIYLLVFGMTDIIGFLMSALGISADSSGSLIRSTVLVLLGGLSFWLANKALVYRKVSAVFTYGIFSFSVLLANWLGNLPLMGALTWLIFPTLLYTAFDSAFWLPANTKAHADEVGINKTIAQTFRRRSIITVSAWIVLIVAAALFIQLKLG